MPDLPAHDFTETVFQRLKENPVFAALGEEIITNLVHKAKIETFESGEILIQQNEVGDFAYVILQGDVSVLLELATGTAEIADIEAGGIVGEIAVFADTKRSATVRAKNRVVAARLERKEIRHFVEQHPDVALGIIAELGKRLQDINQPLGSLTQAAEALRNGNFKPEILESLQSDAGRFRHFADVFKGMAEEITAKMRLNQEMQMAQDIQRAFLPSPYAPLPHENLYEIDAEMIAAKHVGGDFYDYFAVGDDKLAIVVGDVSGKGVPAALFMAAARTVIKTTSQLGLEPSDCVSRVNSIIAEDNEEMMFVTLFYGIVDCTAKTFTYCNAGHNPCYILRDGAEPVMLPPSGAAVGMSEKMTYEQAVQPLQAGEMLFLYTDGVNEAVNSKGEQFTEVKLTEMVSGMAALPPAELVRSVHAAVDEFASGLERFDDTTCLAFKLHSES